MRCEDGHYFYKLTNKKNPKCPRCGKALINTQTVPIEGRKYPIRPGTLRKAQGGAR